MFGLLQHAIGFLYPNTDIHYIAAVVVAVFVSAVVDDDDDDRISNIVNYPIFLHNKISISSLCFGSHLSVTFHRW